MNIKCNKTKLSNSLNIALRAVPGKSSIKILSYIVIEADDNKVKITSNNLDLGIETSFDAEVITPGKICVEAKIFSDMVHKLPSDEVSISVSDFVEVKKEDVEEGEDAVYEKADMTIKSGKANFTLKVLSADTFPQLPSIVKGSSVDITMLGLKNIINQTEFSISENENVVVMTGECFEINGSSLRVIAIDGNRIAIRNVQLSKEYESKKVIIPGKVLREISKILSDDAESMVNMYFTEKHVMFVFDDTVIVSRLIDGNYYAVDRMISYDSNTNIIINKKELHDTIDRSMLLRKEIDKRPLVINISDNNANFNMNASFAAMDEDIEVEKNGDDLTIGFNPKFILDALRAIDDENIKMYFNNSKSPCTIRDDENNYIYIILPINI
ncbi:MAG: DNA polymerase III subunit beta [Lachnospiraceae bacterium]|nr:DNA polymerase III subunit beta [Lachnospiraceae bacterium]